MLIVCPNCKVKYSFDDKRVGVDGIKLRCAKCNSIFRVARKKEGQSSSPSQSTPGIRVVVANESEAFCRAVTSVLSRESFHVSTFNDGRKALDAIVSTRPDVVLLDVALPSMYGFEVCDAIRKNPDIAATKIILIASIYDKTKYKRSPVSLYGADDYIEKHHIPDSLAAMVYRLVAGQKAVESPVANDSALECETRPLQQELSAGELEEQESTRQALRKDEVAGTSAPAPASQPELPEAHKKARRFARIIVSDIALYNQAKVEEGIRKGNFTELLAEELGEGKALYFRRVPEEIASSTCYMEEAIDELIAGKKREFGV